MIVEKLEVDEWASLTFVGELHRIGFRVDGGGDTLDAFRKRLGQILVARDFMLPGRIVAEIAVTDVMRAGVGVAATIEVLTLTD